MAAKPLFDQAAERGLVGAILQDVGVLDTSEVGALTRGDFHNEFLGAAFESAVKHYRAGRIPDFALLAGDLAHLERADSTLAGLLTDASNPWNAGEFVKRIRDLADRRRALALTTQAATAIYNRNGDWRDHVAAAGVDLVQLDDAGAAENALPAEPATWADMRQQIGPVKWLWADWLPAELLIEVVGESGGGKSALVERLSGCFLLGWMWPDGTPFTGERGKVLWCEAEAAQAINLDRAIAWGLPIENILSPFANPLDDVDLFDPKHLAAIEATARRDDVRLIVVDSLSGASGGREKGEDMMPIVKWLAELARNLKKPVVLLHHLRKRGPNDSGDVVTLDRVRGATQIVQPARVVWAVDAPDGTHLERKRLSVIKSNLGKFPKPIGMQIDDGGVIFGEAPQAPKTMTKLDQAKLLLLKFLAGGPQLQTEIENQAILDNISMDTMREAKKKLGITVSKDGHTGKWSWALPDVPNWQGGEQDGDDD